MAPQRGRREAAVCVSAEQVAGNSTTGATIASCAGVQPLFLSHRHGQSHGSPLLLGVVGGAVADLGSRFSVPRRCSYGRSRVRVVADGAFNFSCRFYRVVCSLTIPTETRSDISISLFFLLLIGTFLFTGFLAISPHRPVPNSMNTSSHLAAIASLTSLPILGGTRSDRGLVRAPQSSRQAEQQQQPALDRTESRADELAKKGGNKGKLRSSKDTNCLDASPQSTKASINLSLSSNTE